MKNFLKIFFLFFMLGLLVYSNSLNNKFIMDDYVYLHNPFMSKKFILSQWNPYAAQGLNTAHYRPLTHMVYDLCYPAFKNNFWKYHLFNLFLFVFASSLIYLFFKRLTGNFNVALFAGLFYLLHPINGIIVNYISASVFAFQVICTLGAILLLWESLERKNDRVLYFLSLLLSLSTMFWHESGIMTAFYVSAVVILFRKDPPGTKARYLFPYFLIVLAYMIFRLFFVSFNESVFKQIALFHMRLWECPASLFQIFSWYIAKLFYPKGIVMQWATPLSHDHVFWNNVGAFSMLLCFFLLFVRFAKERVCQLGLAWFLIGFAPACVAAFRMPENGVQIEPHWFSFSSIGFFILAAYFLLMLIERSQKVGLVLLLVIVFGWAASSHAYNQLWADQKTYARYWVREVPHFKMLYSYVGLAYMSEGAYKEAEGYFRRSLNGDPLNYSVYDSIAMAEQLDGHLKEAELNYRKALEINPSYALAYCNLGMLFHQQGQWKKAEECFSQALVYDPDFLGARIALAASLKDRSEYQKAIDLCLKNLDIAPEDTVTLFLLIGIYTHQKDIINIRKYAYRCMNSLTDPKSLTKLGIDMAQHNDPDIAMDCFKKAIRIEGDYKEAYLAGGILLIDLGRIDKAVNMWKIGLSIDPSDGRFKEDIAKVRTLESDRKWAMREFILPIMHKLYIDQNFSFDQIKIH